MPSSLDNFLTNLEQLLTTGDWSNRKLAQKSGVSDRLIGMYRHRESVPSMDKAERIAKALGFELWQMQMPDFAPDVIRSGKFSQLYHTYIEADDSGRRVLETQAEYVAGHNKSTTNDERIREEPGKYSAS
jgi:transcriptional regulator with XRE-family HTH domain